MHVKLRDNVYHVTVYITVMYTIYTLCYIYKFLFYEYAISNGIFRK